MDRVPPPYFCTYTETIADIVNQRILHWPHPPLHKLDGLASTLPALEPRQSCDSPRAPTAVAPPTLRDPLLPQRQRILASIDVFLDDFIAAAQGSTRRLNKIRRILMQSIDHVFRPLDKVTPSA